MAAASVSNIRKQHATSYSKWNLLFIVEELYIKAQIHENENPQAYLKVSITKTRAQNKANIYVLSWISIWMNWFCWISTEGPQVSKQINFNYFQ